MKIKRRNFLKLIVGAVSTVAVPSLVLAKPEQLTFKGVLVKFNNTLENEELFVGLDVDEWMYRGWKVMPKGSINGFESYLANKDKRHINLVIDSALVNHCTNSYGEKRKLINSELDAHIEYADTELLS